MTNFMQLRLVESLHKFKEIVGLVALFLIEGLEEV